MKYRKISITLLFFTGVFYSYSLRSQPANDWSIRINFIADERSSLGTITLGYEIAPNDLSDCETFQLSSTVVLKTLGLPAGYTAEFFPAQITPTSPQPYRGSVTITAPPGATNGITFSICDVAESTCSSVTANGGILTASSGCAEEETGGGGSGGLCPEITVNSNVSGCTGTYTITVSDGSDLSAADIVWDLDGQQFFNTTTFTGGFQGFNTLTVTITNYGPNDTECEYTEVFSLCGGTLPCPVFSLEEKINGCELCLEVVGSYPGTDPAVTVDLSTTPIQWEVDGQDFFDVVEVCVTAPNNTATVVGELAFVYQENGCSVNFSPDFIIDLEESCSCLECGNSFAPQPERKYVLSAWVKEGNALGVFTYTNASISLFFTGDVPANDVTLGPFTPKGPIIDGWQKIEEEFTVPEEAVKIKVELNNTASGEDAFFDDIRIHPFNANMKSFVYDPITLRLVAELDERNYATFYEYDEEGALVRVKKETVKGIMTIQESRNATKKTTP